MPFSFRHRMRAGVLAAALLVPVVDVGAAGYTWMDADGSWSNASLWKEGLIPVSSFTTDLTFGGSGAFGYTSLNDLAGPFQINSLTFNSTAAAAVTISGAQLDLRSDAGVAPQIVQNGSGAVFIQNDLVLTDRLLLTGSAAGTGVVSLDGIITKELQDGEVPGLTGYMMFDKGIWRLTNALNSFLGGLVVRANAILELDDAQSPSVVLDPSLNGLLGNTSGNNNDNRVALNGGVLRIVTNGFGTISIGEGKLIAFNNNGGIVEMLNRNTDDPNGRGGNIIGGEFLPVLGNTAPAIFRFNGGQLGLSDSQTPGSGIWKGGDNVLRFIGFTGNTQGVLGPLRVELSNGAMVRAGSGSSDVGAGDVFVPFTVRGEANGDPTSGPDGLVDTGISKATARVVLDRSSEINYRDSFVFQNALQVSVVGRTRSLGGKLTIAGTSSGFPGYVLFSGRGTDKELSDAVLDPGTDAIGQNVLWLLKNTATLDPTPGLSPSGTLTIQEGAIAAFDSHFRTDSEAPVGNGVALDGLAVLNAGAELRILQSVSAFTPVSGAHARNTGDVIIYGDIRGEGTTAKESILNLYLPEPQPGALVDSTIPATLTSTPTTSVERPYGGVRFDDSRGLADFIVNGSGFGGLKITASPRPASLLNPTVALSDPVSSLAKIDPVVNSTRLSRLTGTGGYLTVATPGNVWSFPVGGEWAAAVPVGLKITDHNLVGADVSFSELTAFSHSIALDGGTLDLGTSPFTYGPATATAGLGLLTGNGTITGPLIAAGGANLSPGLGIGTLTMGDLTFLENARLTIELNGIVPGTAYDQLLVNGSFTLGGNVTLAFSLGFDPVDFSDPLVIVQNDGVDAVQGPGLFRTEAGLLPEAALFDVPFTGGTQTFRISYAGGDGNDVTVRAVPEPNSLTLGIAGLGALLARRRRVM